VLKASGRAAFGRHAPQRGMLQAFRFRRSPLYSDEGPPIGEVAVEEWAKVAFEIAAWVLRWG
jgi:hypothetical protein